MIAETIPTFYDFDGKRISSPNKKRHPWFLGRPIGSFFSQPLTIACRDIDDIRAFLATCRYVSDMEQFGVRDHWMPPEEFEQVRRGDCDDFSLWTWRQFVTLGYDARFVVGAAGRYGAGHAWVSFRVQDQIFIVEPTVARCKKFPRLDTLRYKPSISVEYAGKQVKFYDHRPKADDPALQVVAPLVLEWALFRLRMWSRLLLWPGVAIIRRLRKSRQSPEASHHRSGAA